MFINKASDGANNKYGSFFSPYDFFYAWRKIEADDKEMDGINSLTTMVKGLFRKERLLAVIKDFIYFPDNSDYPGIAANRSSAPEWNQTKKRRRLLVFFLRLLG